MLANYTCSATLDIVNERRWICATYINTDYEPVRSLDQKRKSVLLDWIRFVHVVAAKLLVFDRPAARSDTGAARPQTSNLTQYSTFQEQNSFTPRLDPSRPPTKPHDAIQNLV